MEESPIFIWEGIMNPMMVMMAMQVVGGTISKHMEYENLKESLIEQSVDDGIRAQETLDRFKINAALIERRGKNVASQQALAFAKGNISVSSGVAFQSQVETMGLAFEAISREQRHAEFEWYQLNKSRNSKLNQLQKINEAQFINILSGGMAAGYNMQQGLSDSKSPSGGQPVSGVDKSGLHTVTDYKLRGQQYG